MGYINLSARVSSSFPKATSTMHAIISLITIFGAGRQTKPTHTTHIDTADAITGLPGVRSPEDIMMPVALQSLVKAIAHPVASEEGCKVGRLALPSILKKRKVRAAKKIFKETTPLVPDPETEYMNKLVALHRAAYLVTYREENEKARLKLKALLTYNCEELDEKFDARFPPSLQYFTLGRVREISRNVWEELLARETRLVDQTTGEGSEA
jgi:hypothetical protein